MKNEQPSTKAMANYVAMDSEVLRPLSGEIWTFSPLSIGFSGDPICPPSPS